MTMAALLLLLASVADIGFPVLSKFVFKPENWTGEQEKQFESVCGEVCVAKLAICNGLTYVFASKEAKSPVVSINRHFFVIYIRVWKVSYENITCTNGSLDELLLLDLHYMVHLFLRNVWTEHNKMFTNSNNFCQCKPAQEEGYIILD